MGKSLPDAAERAIIKGESSIPWVNLEIELRVAGASIRPSKLPSWDISESHSVITLAPEPHDNANGEITFSADLLIIGKTLAPCLLSSLASLIDSVAAIPPETARMTLFPSRLSPLTVTPVSSLTTLLLVGH